MDTEFKSENTITPQTATADTINELFQPTIAHCTSVTTICKIEDVQDADIAEDMKTVQLSTGDEPSNVSEAEDQVKKLPYPKAVYFILSNEFCDRFNYFGMRTILVLYLSNQLNYSEATATVVYHALTMFVYFLSIFGAIVSDSWLGKFNTMLYFSLVYMCGSILMSLAAIPPLNLPASTLTMIGLALIALGSGSVKPVREAFGSDQYEVPQQIKQVTAFFSLLYFVENAGILISTLITPILRADVYCFGQTECYSLAFGVPAVLVIISIVIFLLGKPWYKCKPPAGNMVVLVSKAIGNAISTKWREKKTNPREHWLDYADKNYDKQLIEDVKVLLRVLVLFLPIPIFWALYDQRGSSWTFQAARMDGNMGSWKIEPGQMQVFSSILTLLFIPLYEVAFYPALSLIGIRRPLQKLTLGGILAGIAFILSAIVELNLEKTYPVLPSPGYIQLRVFSGVPGCQYTIQTNNTNLPEISLNGIDYWCNKTIQVEHQKLTMSYNITANQEDCPKFLEGIYTFNETTAYSMFLQNKIDNQPILIYKDQVDKSSNSAPLVRNLANIEKNRLIKWRVTNTQDIESTELASYREIIKLKSTTYDVLVDDVKVHEEVLRDGGIYSLIIGSQMNGDIITKMIVITEPNSINILWQIPQYIVMILGEVMFAVTGMKFSNSEAPVSMKSVLQAVWLLTVAFGNVIVIIVAEWQFASQANEYFLFAGLMFVDMILFMWVAYCYKPNKSNFQEYQQEMEVAQQSCQQRYTKMD